MGKENPDDGFLYDDPEYKKLKAEYNEYRGMDGKIAKSKVMKHPGGEIRNGKLKHLIQRWKTNEVGRRTI